MSSLRGHAVAFSLARSTPEWKRRIGKGILVRMLRPIPHPFPLAFSRHDNSPVFPPHFDQPGSFSLSLSSERARARNGYREFIREYEPAIYNSLGCLSGKRRGATNPMVNIKQRYCIGSVRIRFDVPPPPASVSSSSFMAAIGHLSYRRLFLRLIY